MVEDPSHPRITWCIQNNRIDRVTGALASAVRLSGRKLHDFSYYPGKSLNRQIPRAASPRFFFGENKLIERLYGDPEYCDDLFYDPINLTQAAWLEAHGQAMLNADGDRRLLGDLPDYSNDTPYFVRPLINIKAFSGTVIRPGRFGIWRAQQQELNPTLHDGLPVWTAPVKTLKAEYRFIVSGGFICGYSSYKEGTYVVYNEDIPPNALHAATMLAGVWQPSDLCTMDVAELEDGTFRIVEFNCVHSAALYAANLSRFMAVVESAYGRRRALAALTPED